MHWKLLPLQFELVEEQPSLLGKALAVEVAKKIKARPPFMPSVCLPYCAQPSNLCQSWLFPLPLLTPNSLPSGTSSAQH